MIPLRRCGSHAIRIRLNFSPEFYSPYPLHITDFADLSELYGDLSDDRDYFWLVTELVGLQNASMVKWEQVVLDPVAIFEAVREYPRSIHRVVWEMLFQAGRQHQASVVMDKSLDSVCHAEELVCLFENMKFLNVVRDPRAQVSSMNRSIIYDFETLLNAERWVRAYDAALALMRKYPEKVLTVRFEDFISDQKSVLQRICDFIEIEFLDAMLDVSKSREAVNISKLSELWKYNAFPPLPANLAKFRKYLSMEEIGIIETLAGPLMEYYGYVKMTPAQAEISDTLFADAYRRSETKRQQAWKVLEKENSYDYVLRTFRSNYIGSVKTRLTNKA